MALLLKKLFNGYNWLLYEKADPRTNDSIVSSPLVPLAIIGLYLYIVKYAGPKWMHNRKPFNIEKLLIVYNLVQIWANLYLLYEIRHVPKKIVCSCVPVDYTQSLTAMAELESTKKFLWLKIFDLIDTVFFVLRKSNRQITALHVTHHFGMIAVTWAGFKYTPGGHSLFVGVLNLPVHAMMFIYYLLTSIDSSWKRNIPIKRFLTQLQMLQFLAFIIIYGRALTDFNCPFPKFLCYQFVISNIFMLLMFYDFYQKTYLLHQKKKLDLE